MPLDLLGGAVEQLPYLVRRYQLGRAEIGFMEAPCDATHRVHFEAFRKPRLATDQTDQPDPQFRRQGLGEGRQQDTAVGMRARKVDRPMQRHDGLAGARGAGNSCRATVVALHDVALSRMEEDAPLLPEIVEGLTKLFRVLHRPKSTLRVRVRERIGRRTRVRGRRWWP